MGDSRDVARRFGENLRRARRRTDISQEEVGFRAGLHRTEVGLLERGARVPRIDTLVKLAGGLGVDTAVLLEGIEWTEGETTTTPGGFTFTTRQERHARAMKLAAKVRDGQSKIVDAVQLVNEGREEREEQIARALRGDS